MPVEFSRGNLDWSAGDFPLSQIPRTLSISHALNPTTALSTSAPFIIIHH